MICPNCAHKGIEKGRAFDGRRTYRCRKCGYTWTRGLQGRQPRYSKQRQGTQFATKGKDE